MEEKSTSDAQKRRLQMEITILETDLQKQVREKGELDIEVRRLKREKDLLDLNLGEKEEELRKAGAEEAVLQGQIRGLKKKMNSL